MYQQGFWHFTQLNFGKTVGKTRGSPGRPIGGPPSLSTSFHIFRVSRYADSCAVGSRPLFVDSLIDGD
jgi:hypothetical protein